MLVCSPQGSTSHTDGSATTLTPVWSAMVDIALGSTVLSLRSTGWSSASLIRAEESGAAEVRGADRTERANTDDARTATIGCRMGNLLGSFKGAGVRAAFRASGRRPRR